MNGNVYANDLLRIQTCERIIVDIENSLNASRRIETTSPQIKQHFLNNVKTLSEVYDNYCKN